MLNKILVFGYGSSGNRYSKIIKKKYPKINLKVFTNQKKVIGKNFIKNYKQIKDYNPDLTIICNPSTNRVKIFNFLKKTKSHILFEKPLAGNYQQSIKINNKKNTIYRVGYNLKQLELLHKFKSIIKKKKFGKILYFSIHANQYLPDWRKRDYRKTVSANKNLGGGVILELSHEIDYAIYLFGKFKTIKSIKLKVSKLKLDTEDICKMLVITNKNIFGSIHVDFCSQNKLRHCIIETEKGRLKLNFLKKNIYFQEKNKKPKIIFKSKQKIVDTYKSQIDEIISLIKKKKTSKNLSTLKTSKYILKVIDKIKDKYE